MFGRIESAKVVTDVARTAVVARTIERINVIFFLHLLIPTEELLLNVALRSFLSQ